MQIRYAIIGIKAYNTHEAYYLCMAYGQFTLVVPPVLLIFRPAVVMTTLIWSGMVPGGDIRRSRLPSMDARVA